MGYSVPLFGLHPRIPVPTQPNGNKKDASLQSIEFF
jgi:hypothetical protein